MPKDTVGPTCLYKDGTSEVFEGEFVAKAIDDGWCESPAEAKAQAEKEAAEAKAKKSK